MSINKKFIVISALIITLVLCSALLIACDGSTDKASKNAEFVSFRKKVVRILKDNGIFVNDLDKTTAIADGSGRIFAQASLLYADGSKDKISQIGDVLSQSEYLAESENYEFALKQIYSIALKLSLCVGDGLSNYFDEKKLYDIPVFIPDINMVITENGDTVSIKTYQDNVGTEYLQEIKVVFDTETDYYFTVTELTGNFNSQSESVEKRYMYGDSGKRFVMCDASEVTYSPDGSTFYNASDTKVASNCIDILGEEVFDFNVAEFRQIQSNVKHRFTQEQFNALNDKYFKDVQSSTDPEHDKDGIRYETIGGQQVATHYWASDGQTEVVIPSDVSVIRSDFSVEDRVGSVKTLYIPKSVKRIVDGDGRDVTDMNDFRLVLATSGQYEVDVRIFSDITVENGSPLFKAGSGHLTSKNNDVIVYVLDKPMTTLDFNVIAKVINLQRSGYEYKNIYKLPGTSVTFDISDMYSVCQKYGVNDSELKEQIQKIINSSKSLETFNINISVPELTESNGDKSEGGRSDFGLYIDLVKDVTINVTYSGLKPNCFADVMVDLDNKTNEKHTVTVNVDGYTFGASLSVNPLQPSYSYDKDKGEMPPEVEYVPNPLIFTSFNFNMPKILFDAHFDVYISRDKANSEIKFTEEWGDWAKGFTLIDGNCLCVDDTAEDGSTITFPEKNYVGIELQRAVNINLDLLGTKSLTIVLPKDVDINFEGNEYCNENFVIQYTGTIAELESKFEREMDSGREIQFTAKCTDGEKFMRLGWKFSPNNPNNPDNFKYAVTVNIEGVDTQFKVKGEDWSNTLLLQETYDDYAYFLVNDADDTFIGLKFTDGEKALYAHFEKEHNGQHFTLYKHIAGNAVVVNENPDKPEYPEGDPRPEQKVVARDYKLFSENYDMIVTVAFVRNAEDVYRGGWAMISGIVGTINGNAIDFDGADECTSYDPQLGSQIVLFTDGGNYFANLSFSADGIKLIKLKPTNLLENVEIKIGSLVIMQDFHVDDIYRFTEDQLPEGDYEYFCFAEHQFDRLPKDEDGYYLKIWREATNNIVKLYDGERQYNCVGENYDITVTLDWTLPDANEVELGEIVELRLVGVSGTVNGFDITDDAPTIEQNGNHSYEGNIWNPYDEFSVEFKYGFVDCKLYAEGFDIKIEIEHIEFWGDKEGA